MSHVISAHDPPAPVPSALRETSDPHSTVAYMRDPVGVTVREIAQVTGAEERSVRRWADDPEVKLQARYAERIDDLRHLIGLLAPSLPGEQAARWLRARNRLLNGERPIELLADPSQYARVLDAAEAFIDGDVL